MAVHAAQHWAMEVGRVPSALVAGASGPGQMGLPALRYKLSQAYCPTAAETEQSLLACKNYTLGRSRAVAPFP